MLKRVSTCSTLSFEHPPDMVVIRVNEFTGDEVNYFIDEFDKAISNKQPAIPIVVDSYGGGVYEFLTIADLILSSPVPVHTIAMGKTMSCGMALFMLGKERWFAPNAFGMIHDIATYSGGKIEEVKADTKQTEKLYRKVMEVSCANVGRSVEYFLDIIHKKSHADWFFGAKEAKKHGIATHIGVPEFTLEVKPVYYWGPRR